MEKEAVRNIVIAVAIAAFHLPGAAHALMPPLSPEELKQESNQIVEGKILDVVCTGEHDKNRCAELTGYKATLKVMKTIKGKRYKKLELSFKKYDFKKGCVGSPDTVHYPGEEALYYLRCKENRCHLTHWNGIIFKSHGNRSLPKCS
jgi:hypothetical protein